MSTLRLVNPQPMETLPDSGEVFTEYHCADCKPPILIELEDVSIVRLADIDHVYYKAWSYTATTEPNNNEGEQRA